MKAQGLIVLGLRSSKEVRIEVKMQVARPQRLPVGMSLLEAKETGGGGDHASST